MKQLQFLFLAIVIASSLAHAQDTLKTKYQTKDVIINDKKLKFEPSGLFVVENGPVLVEKGKNLYRLKDLASKDYLHITDSTDWKVLGGKFLVIERKDSVFQIFTDKMNYIGNKAQLLPYAYAMAFAKNLVILFSSNNYKGFYFGIWNTNSEYINNYYFFDEKAVKMYLQRERMIIAQSFQFANEEMRNDFIAFENKFTRNFITPPRPIGAFEKDGALRIVSIAQESIFFVDSLGAISGSVKLKGCNKLSPKMRLLNDPVTNLIYAVSKGVKNQIFLLNEKNLTVEAITKVTNIDIDNCGIFNGTFYYLKHEMPYGKSVQSVRLK